MQPFKTIYWGSDSSTEVVFEPLPSLPPDDQVSACMVVAFHEGKIAMSRPMRGWGLVGGHREKGETAEMCIRREAMEEAAIELGDLRLIGRWMTRKLFDSPENQQYLSVAYQLLYTAKVTKKNDFIPQLEIEARTFATIEELPKLHHNFSDFEDVYTFIVSSQLA